MAIQGTGSQIRNIRAIYFITTMSLLEAIGLSIFYIVSVLRIWDLLINYMDSHLQIPAHVPIALTVQASFLLVYLIRIIISIVAIVGHALRNRRILLFFVLWTAVAILFNIGLGVVAARTTLLIPIASFVVIALHILYIAVGWRVWKEDKIFRTSFNPVDGPLGFVPRVAPLQAPINIQHSHQYNNQYLQNVSMGYGPPAPPMYTEAPADSGNIGDKLPDKFESDTSQYKMP